MLTDHPGSVLINVHSVASWNAFGGVYGVSKAALWSATNSLRLELDNRGVHVVGVHVGYVDTPKASQASGEKTAPHDLVRKVFDAVEVDEYEVIADEVSANVKAARSGPIEALYPQLASSRKMWSYSLQFTGAGTLNDDL